MAGVGPARHRSLKWAAIGAGVLTLLALMIAARTPFVALDARLSGIVTIPPDHPAWTLAHWITEWGGGAAISAVLVTISLMFVCDGRLRLLPPLWLGFAGARVITDGLKHLIERPRPEMAEYVRLLADATSPAFPSGHATSATFVYGFLAFLVERSARGPGMRRALVLLLAVLVLGVGVSRMVLGVHYPSDVLAGYLSGGIMLALAAAAADRWSGSR